MNVVDPVSETPAAIAIGFDRSAHANASAVLFDNLARNPEAVALRGEAGTLTYARLCARAARFGHAFAGAGLERGERIAFVLDDTPEFAAAFFGAVRAGFVPVLLNTQLGADLLEFYLRDSGARVALCEAPLLEHFDPSVTRATALERIVVANGDETQADGVAAFVDACDESLDAADTAPGDMAFWMYSSGSTGRPKGIVHLQHDMAYTAASYAANVLRLEADDICFSVPKMFFAYGFGNSLTFPFSVGASSVLLPGRPSPERVLQTIARWRPSVLFALPTVYTALCRSSGAKDAQLDSLRLCISAAETLSEEIFTAWRALSGLEAIEGLGSTEMLHIYLSNTQADRRIGSAGQAVPGYEVELRDERGAPTSDEGVMWVRGDSSAPMYWQRPSQTAKTMQADWVCTGDRFVLRDGYYYFQGRNDDLVKVSGQWVWPLEVERCLAEHAAVDECVVMAHALRDGRTTLSAFVSLNAGEVPGDDTTGALQAHVKTCLQPHKYPRRIDYLDALPKTGTGKLDRQALAARLPKD